MPASFAKHRPRFRPTPLKRASAAARGYGTSWRERREYAKRSGCCGPYVCSENGCGATERLNLDHKIPRSRGGSDDWSNLQWKCPGHHSSKTASFDGGFGNPKKTNQ